MNTGGRKKKQGGREGRRTMRKGRKKLIGKIRRI